MSDTVGFIRKLPTQLIESFKSTLDEVREADLLLHVVDISHPNFEEHIESVQNILTDIEDRKHFVGSLYDLSAPSKEMIVYPSNKWNSYHIIINYNKNFGKVILNNKLINSFPLKGQKWDSMLRKSKFSKSDDYPYLGDSRWYDFGKFHRGKICFQDHPGEVSFKNVRIREIK